MQQQKKHVSSHEEQIRLNLKNSLLAAGVTPYQFGQAAGFGSNSTGTITRFIEGTGKRATMKSVLAKIVKGMKQKGWLKQAEPEGPAEAAKILEEFKKTPTDLFPAQDESEDPTGTLTREQMFRVIQTVMNTDWPVDERYAILGKLFPDCR